MEPNGGSTEEECERDLHVVNMLEGMERMEAMCQPTCTLRTGEE